MFDLLMHAAPSAWRRAREPLVRALLARRGAARTVNGIPLRVDPVGRHVFTPIYDEGAAACLRTHLREGMEAWNVGRTSAFTHSSSRTWSAPPGASSPSSRTRRRVTCWCAISRAIRCSRASKSCRRPWGRARHGGLLHLGRRRHGSRRPAQSPIVRDGSDEVPVTTLDAFASARGRLPDLVVMDIEGWEIAALEGARSHLGRTRFIVELHPDAWQWSGHTRRSRRAARFRWAGGAPAQRPARPAWRARASRPRGESIFGRQPLVLKATGEGEKGRIRDLGGDHALAVGGLGRSMRPRSTYQAILVTKRTSTPLLAFSCCILGAAVAGTSEDLGASRPRFVIA